jgi:ATP-dependent Clp protease ATP-binding subunit ClpB
LRLPEITRIVDLQFNILKKRLTERKIEISLTQSAKDLIAKTGYDPSFGARPLKRTIQHKILDPLAMKILDKEFAQGDSIEVDVEDEELVFRKVQ